MQHGTLGESRTACCIFHTWREPVSTFVTGLLAVWNVWHLWHLCSTHRRSIIRCNLMLTGKANYSAPPILHHHPHPHPHPHHHPHHHPHPHFPSHTPIPPTPEAISTRNNPACFRPCTVRWLLPWCELTRGTATSGMGLTQHQNPVSVLQPHTTYQSHQLSHSRSLPLLPLPLLAPRNRGLYSAPINRILRTAVTLKDPIYFSTKASRKHNNKVNMTNSLESSRPILNEVSR